MPLLKVTYATEAEEQEAFFTMIETHKTKFPILKWIFMIPNGAKLQATYQRQADGSNLRESKEGATLKRQGLQKGVPDIFVPIPRWAGFGNSPDRNQKMMAGLFIEMKRLNAVPSDTKPDQLAYHEFLRSQGYAVIVSKGWRAAWNSLCEYLTELKDLEVR